MKPPECWGGFCIFDSTAHPTEFPADQSPKTRVAFVLSETVPNLPEKQVLNFLKIPSEKRKP